MNNTQAALPEVSPMDDFVVKPQDPMITNAWVANPLNVISEYADG